MEGHNLLKAGLVIFAAVLIANVAGDLLDKHVFKTKA